MGLYEPDYLSRFLDVVGMCETYPYSARLKNTGKWLTLYKIDAMMYMDIESMLSVLAEIFDTSISGEIVGYVRKILFIETLAVHINGEEVQKELICINLIDNKALLKFHNWLFDYFAHKNDEEQLFQKITMNGIAKQFNDFYSDEQQMEQADDGYRHYEDSLCPGEEENPFTLAHAPAYDQAPAPQKGYPLACAKPRGKHMPQRREPSFERPFVCEYYGCRRAFKRQEHLKRHVKMHTGERPFKCLFPGCQKSFSRSDNLNSHYKTHNIARKGVYKTYTAGKTLEEY
ncbi:hypothetical protein PAPHI01_0045 [Pancytospora philotis]|nr:hypothetical protein PAPHI01_0045 [Pancytospora philotis]